MLRILGEYIFRPSTMGEAGIPGGQNEAHTDHRCLRWY